MFYAVLLVYRLKGSEMGTMEKSIQASRRMAPGKSGFLALTLDDVVQYVLGYAPLRG
jgi:hypothetical protein